MSRLLFLTAAGAILLGAQPPVGGPSLGFIFDAPGQALRPILGIPGAAIFGDPLQNPAAISTAAISLRQNVAIVNDGAWKAITLSGSTVTAASTLPDGLPSTGQISVSETGTAAAFYDSGNNALTVVTGIPSSNMTVTPVSLDPLPGAITALAASDDGSLLLSSAVPGGGEALFWIGQDGSARQLATLQAAASILLWNHGATALVVDRAANQVRKIQDPGGNAAVSLLASDADGVSGPVGAALSADGKLLWIANAANRTVLGIDTTTRAVTSLPCAFDLTTLLPMADGATLRLNELNTGPVWMVDAAPGADPRIVFIPAIERPSAPQEDAQ